MTLQFNTIPGNIVAPIFSFEINSGGQFENASRVLAIGHRIAAGAAADNVPVPCYSTMEGRRLAGAGSMLDDMVRKHFANAPAQELWVLPVPATGTAAVWTVSVDSVLSGGGQGVIEIAGRSVAVTYAAGDAATAVATALAAAVNNFYDPLSEASLPVTAAVGGEGHEDEVVLTARHAGLAGNEIDVHVPVLAGGNAFAGKLTITATTAGSGSPDLSAGLAALGDDPFDWIVSAFSDDTNIARYKALLNDVSGRWAWNRQIYGHVFYPKTASTGDMTTHGLAQDDRHISIIPRPASAGVPEPGWEWAAAVAARIVPWLSDGATGNVSRNHTGLVVQGLRAPRDRSKWYGYAARDAFLRSGVSTWVVDTVGRVTVDKIVTTQRTTNGVTDTTFRDIQKIGQLIYVLRKLRSALAIEHGQKALADDNPGNVMSVTTTRDIAATFMHAYQEMVLTGVLENAVLAAEMLRVERNADNPNRVDIYAPLDMVNPLDIMAANARVYSQF